MMLIYNCNIKSVISCYKYKNVLFIKPAAHARNMKHKKLTYFGVRRKRNSPEIWAAFHQIFALKSHKSVERNIKHDATHLYNKYYGNICKN